MLKSLFLLFAIFMIGTLPSRAESKPLFAFEKGEISPGLARSIEKTGPDQYTLHFDNPKPGFVDKAHKAIESALSAFPKTKVKTQGQSIQVQFKGPDTPVLQALSTVNLEP